MSPTRSRSRWTPPCSASEPRCYAAHLKRHSATVRGMGLMAAANIIEALTGSP